MTLRELDSLGYDSGNSYSSFEGTVEDERQKAQDWLDQYHKTHDEPSFWESAGSLLKSAWDSGSSYASKAWGEIEDAFSLTASSVKAAEKTKKEEEDRFRLGKDLEDSKFKFGVGREGMSSTASEYIDEISSKVSSTYKKYKGTDYLPLSENNIKELAAEHEARAKVDGQEAADMWLDGFYKDIAASNQSWVEQAWHAVSHLVPAIEGGVISTFGMAYGATKFALEHPFGLNSSLAEYALTKESYNPLYDFIDNVIDNPITRYGDEIERYGASHVLDGLKLIGWSDETSAERIAHTKATATEYNPEGITNDAILKTQEQEDSIFNSTLPWEALQSGGFTLLSMITGAGLSRGANMVFGKAAKGMRALHATGRAFKTEEALIRGLEGLKQVQNYTNLFAIPGAVGSVEGCMEGLHTKMDVQREGDNIVQDFFNKKIEQDTQRLLDSGKYQSEEAARIAAFKLNEDAINDAKKQVDYAASRAGVNNFFCNAAINGFMMQTFKAGLMAPPVRETLRNSRLTGWAFKKSKFNVSADNVVTPKTSKLKTILNVLKEPAGEGIEEWTQNISSETTSAAAENNIAEFVKGRVDPSSNVEVGDAFTSDVAAAWTAFTGSLFNKESLQSAVLGTVSSVMGTPALAHRGYYRNEEGKLTKRSIFSLKNFTPSLNEKGEQETWSDVARRMTPWRSGLFSAVFEESEEQTKAKKVADMLTEWIKDPKNKEKWDGLVGTANWLSKMIHAAESNDQFSYRTAQMGKAINDIFMLTKLKGTEFYNSFMADLERAANLTTESASASDLIDKMKENDKEGTLNKSDEEIVQKINDNANKMLELISSVQKEEQNIDSMLGRVDDDTKQGLVFGKVMADSFRKRKEQLEEEVERIKANITSSNNSNSSSEPVPNSLSGLIAKYGSGAAIMKAKEGIENEIEEAKKRVADIEGKKEEDRTDKERETLAQDKNSIAQKEEQLKEFDPIYEDDGEGGKKVISGLSSLVLTEEEIMNLDNISRAIMLAQGATKLYNATHQNHQKVNELNLKVDNLNRQIEEEDAKIKKWSNPDGSAKKRHTKQLEKARGRHAELLEQKRQAMEELDAEQGEMKDKKKYYSDAQQAVIDNLVEQGKAIDDDFLDKIIDIGRIEKAQKAHNKQYIEILSDPRVFQNYVKGAQEEAKMNLTRMRAERLSRTVNYQDYADEFNNMMSNPSNEEASEIISTLQRESDNQKREYYTEKAKELEEAGQEVKYDENGDLVGYKLETNWDKLVQNQEAVYNVALTVADDADMSDNDRSLTMAAAQYLLSKGVNIEDENAFVDSLIESDDQGEAGGKFRQYIEKRNSEVSEPQRIVYTSIGNVVEDFKKAISRIKAKRDAQESASVNARAGHVDGGTSAVPPPKASPAAQQPQAQDEQKDKKSFSFVNGSNPEDLVGFLEEQLADTIPDVWKEDIKAIAGKITGSNAPNAVKDLVLANLLNLKTYGKLSKEEFLDAINNIKSSLIAKSNDEENKDNDYSKAAKIIDNIARYLFVQKDKEAPSSSNAFAATIQCVNLKYFRERFPGTWPVLFADRHNIDNWLKDNPVSRDTDLFFLRDSAWDKEAADGMGDSYNQSENRPVVVAVEVAAPEHPENSTAIQADGRWFQPIGILPSTTSVNSGSGHTKTIRSHIYEAEGCHLITENGAPDGEPLRTRITGANFIRAISPSGTDTPNRIVDLILQFVHPEERDKLSVSTLEDRKKNISFKAAVKRFIEHLGVKKINGKESLVYINDRMRGNPNERKGSPIAINRRTLADTTNSKTGKSLLEVLKGGDLEELENFNSRTQRILNRVLGPLFVNNAVHTDAMPLGGNLSPQERKVAEEKATRLINGYLPGRTETSGLHGISDYLFMNDDYSLSIEYDQEDFSTIKVKLVSPNEETIDVGTYSLNDKNLPVQLLRDILYDGNEIRPFLLWQISYSDIGIVGNTDPALAKAREEAIDNLIGLVEDDILIAPTNSLDYIIESVHIQSPFSGMPGSARIVFPTVANPNNAGGGGAAPAGDGAITDGNGNPILPGSGATLGGQEKSKTGKTPAEDRAEKLALAIVADSKRFTLGKDDKYYYVTDKTTGKTTKYLRVTSIGSADIDAPAAVSNNPVEVAQRTTTQLNQAMREIGIDMHYEDEMGDYLQQHGEEVQKSQSNTQQAIEANKEMPNQQFQTPQGTVYGFATPEGSIYLDRTIIKPEHPIHEYTHLWDRAVIQKNERLWNRGVELMKKLDLWKAILNDDNYGKKWKAKGISGKQLENLIASEVHSRLVGRRGQEYLEKVEAKHKGDRRSIVGKLRRWLLDMWKEVAKTFGVWTDEDLRNLTLNDFVNMTLRDLTQGINPNTATAENTTDAVLEEIQKRIDAIGENNIELTGKENAKELAEKLGVPVFEAKKLMAEARQKIREESFKLWKVPSTTLGNTIDIIVRDFFNGELKTHYKNITDRALAVLVQQLEYFKSNLGITIISKDVVAHGKVTVTDDDGNTRDIDVAGTVDLLGYDKNGNFYIFDMKTTRSHSPNKIVREKPKWTRQLSMYRDLLLQQWQEKGLNIPKENIHIIPINVPRYPEPTSEDDYIEEDGQLKRKVNGEYKDYNMDIHPDKTTEDNGDNYFGLRQTTAKQVDLTYKKLDIQWDRMSADDQDIADEMLLADNDGLEGVVSSDIEKITIEGSNPNRNPLDPLEDVDVGGTDDNPIDIPSINPIASQVSGTLEYDDFNPEQQGLIDDMDLSLEDIKDNIAALEEFAMCSTRRK